MIKKLLFSLCLSLVVVSSAIGAVGVKEDDSMLGAATDIDFSTNIDVSHDGSKATVTLNNSPTVTGDVTFRSNIISIGRIAASSSLDSSSNGIGVGNVPYCYIRKIMSGTEACTIPDGTPGQILVLIVIADAPGSGSTWTLTPTTSQVVSTILMTAVADQVTLLYVNDAIGWIVLDESSSEEGTVTVTYNLDGN